MKLIGGALAAALVVSGCDPRPEPADLVLRGGVVRTMESRAPTASAMAVRADRIVYVGDEAGTSSWVGPETEVVELGGRLVLPGFHDTHVHALDGGVGRSDCDLYAAVTRAELINAVRACAERGADWIRGGGYDPTLFPNGEPPRELLDSLVADRPAYLVDATGHAAWVNSHALTVAGIDAPTPAPAPGGVIVRNADGSLQGTLREGAMELVARHLPSRTDAELRAGLSLALELAASMGLTTLHEASADEPTVRAYAEAEADNRLSARVRLFVRVDPGRGAAQAGDIVVLRDRYAGRLARVSGAKIFLDGVLEGGTAALLEPYVDRPGWRGELRAPSVDSLAALVGALESAGLAAHFHAIGDRAVRTALDAIDGSHTTGPPQNARHVIAHLQLVDAADLPRLAELGVVASFQPLWAQRDAYVIELTEPRLGPERSGRLYPIGSVLASGAAVAAGSDWPVTTLDPLDAIEVAVTRRNEAAAAGQAWITEERLTVEEAVRAYTAGGAYAAGLEDETGTIEVGKLADLVVLDRDIFVIEVTEISEATVDLTLLEGRVIYRRPQP
jgi:predicted amidohydrolase YtcJ